MQRTEQNHAKFSSLLLNWNKTMYQTYITTGRHTERQTYRQTGRETYRESSFHGSDAVALWTLGVCHSI